MASYEPYDFQGLPEVEYEDNVTQTLEDYANFQPDPNRPDPYATMTPDELWEAVDKDLKAFEESQRKKEAALKLLSPVAQARAKAKALAKKSARVKTRVLSGGRQLLAPLTGYAGLRKTWDDSDDEEHSSPSGSSQQSTPRAGGRASAAGRSSNRKGRQMMDEAEQELIRANHAKILERYGSVEELGRLMASLHKDYATQTPQQISDLLADERRLTLMEEFDVNNRMILQLQEKLANPLKRVSVASEKGSVWSSGGCEHALAVLNGGKGTLDEDLERAGWGAELDGEEESEDEDEDDDDDDDGSDGDWDSGSGSEEDGDGVDSDSDDDDGEEEFHDALSRPPTPPAKVDPRDMWRLYGPEIEKTIAILTAVSKLQ